MTYCSNCGVELDDGLEVCPLCGKDMNDKGEQEYISNNYPSNIIRLQRKENRRYLWELSGIIAFSGIAACTIIDLLISKVLSWSLYSDVSISLTWVILTLFQFLYKRMWTIIIFLMFTILSALFLFDGIDTGRGWFFPVGLPITTAAFVTAGIVLFLYKSAILKGLNIIAAALIALSGFCILLEMILDKYLRGVVNFQWSLIVAISIIPVALVIFFHYYRLEKGNRLDSLFHI